MKDLNFFEPFIEKTDYRISSKVIYLSLFLVVIISFATFTTYNAILIKGEAKLVDSLKIMANNQKLIDRVELIQEKEIEVSEFRDSVDKIRQLNKTLEDKDIIKESLLDDITSKMPEDLFLTSISIHNKDIQLVGISKDKWSIAELEKGLEGIDGIDEIFISNISLQDDYYNFNVNITIKDVSNSGEELEEEENEV